MNKDAKTSTTCVAEETPHAVLTRTAGTGNSNIAVSLTKLHSSCVVPWAYGIDVLVMTRLSKPLL